MQEVGFDEYLGELQEQVAAHGTSAPRRRLHVQGVLGEVRPLEVVLESVGVGDEALACGRPPDVEDGAAVQSLLRGDAVLTPLFLPEVPSTSKQWTQLVKAAHADWTLAPAVTSSPPTSRG